MGKKLRLSARKGKKHSSNVLENQETTTSQSSSVVSVTSTQEESSPVPKRRNPRLPTPGPLRKSERLRKQTVSTIDEVVPETPTVTPTTCMDNVPAGCSKDPVYMALESSLVEHEDIQKDDGRFHYFFLNCSFIPITYVTVLIC